MNKLQQIPMELLKKLKECSTDKQIYNLGFQYYDRLINCKGFENFSERLCLWFKLDGHKIYTIVTCDLGNAYCELHTHDILIKELSEEVKKEKFKRGQIINREIEGQERELIVLRKSKEKGNLLCKELCRLERNSCFVIEGELENELDYKNLTKAILKNINCIFDLEYYLDSEVMDILREDIQDLLYEIG